MKRIIYTLLVISFLSLDCKKSTEAVSSNPIPPSSYNHSRNPGNSARDYLRSTIYQSLKIEVQYMPGYEPDIRAINNFVDLISGKLNKPGGIIIEKRMIDPTLRTTFSLDDISDIEYRDRTVFTTGTQMSAYILFVDGSYSDGNVLGLSYKNTSICFFGEPLRYFSGGLTADDKVKLIAMLLAHEFGHLLGLVDMGSPMVVDHQDNVNNNHCNNPACIMHHAYEPNSLKFARNYIGDPFFDLNCSNDLRSNGGK